MLKLLFARKIASIRGRLDSHTIEVVRGASVAFILKALGAVLAFAFNIRLTKLLGADDAGIYFLAITIVTIAGSMSCVGLDNTLLRFVAMNAAVDDWGTLKGACRKGITIALFASVSLTLALFFSAGWISTEIFSKPELTWSLRMMSVAIVPMTVLTLYAEMLKGLKRIRDSNLVQGVGIWGLALVGLFVLNSGERIHTAVWAYILAVVLTAVLAFSIWRLATSHIRCERVRFETSKLLNTCIPLFWVSLLSLLVSLTSTFILGIYGTKAEIGIFGAASRTAFLISFILVAINSISAPKFAALYRLKDMKALGSTARNSAKLLTILSAPVLLLFILFPSWVMGIYGAEFVAGGSVLIILAIGQFINVSTGSVGYLLIMSGNEKIMRNNLIAVTVLNVGLNFLLIPKYGMMGAAVATSISVSFQNLMASYLVHKSIKINTIPWLRA
ncbi:MAG: flippase [Deltaproteobacteria bacterium]|nr:flippase [Deltaproteobacteria bacterium]